MCILIRIFISCENNKQIRMLFIVNILIMLGFEPNSAEYSKYIQHALHKLHKHI